MPTWAGYTNLNNSMFREGISRTFLRFILRTTCSTITSIKRLAWYFFIRGRILGIVLKENKFYDIIIA